MRLLPACIVQCMQHQVHACMHACAHTMKSLTRIFLMVPSGKFSLLSTSMGLGSMRARAGPTEQACIHPQCALLTAWPSCSCPSAAIRPVAAAPPHRLAAPRLPRHAVSFKRLRTGVLRLLRPEPAAGADAKHTGNVTSLRRAVLSFRMLLGTHVAEGTNSSFKLPTLMKFAPHVSICAVNAGCTWMVTPSLPELELVEGAPAGKPPNFSTPAWGHATSAKDLLWAMRMHAGDEEVQYVYLELPKNLPAGTKLAIEVSSTPAGGWLAAGMAPCPDMG